MPPDVGTVAVASGFESWARVVEVAGRCESGFGCGRGVVVLAAEDGGGAGGVWTGGGIGGGGRLASASEMGGGCGVVVAVASRRMQWCCRKLGAQHTTWRGPRSLGHEPMIGEEAGGWMAVEHRLGRADGRRSDGRGGRGRAMEQATLCVRFMRLLYVNVKYIHTYTHPYIMHRVGNRYGISSLRPSQSRPPDPEGGTHKEAPPCNWKLPPGIVWVIAIRRSIRRSTAVTPLKALDPEGGSAPDPEGLLDDCSRVHAGAMGWKPTTSLLPISPCSFPSFQFEAKRCKSRARSHSFTQPK